MPETGQVNPYGVVTCGRIENHWKKGRRGTHCRSASKSVAPAYARSGCKPMNSFYSGTALCHCTGWLTKDPGPHRAAVHVVIQATSYANPCLSHSLGCVYDGTMRRFVHSINHALFLSHLQLLLGVFPDTREDFHVSFSGVHFEANPGAPLDILPEVVVREVARNSKETPVQRANFGGTGSHRSTPARNQGWC